VIISGHTAVVPGGASRLGQATVERPAADGAKLAIFDLNGDPGGGNAVVEPAIAGAGLNRERPWAF
jgi:NAD(P)-dependent dehydrogenase (short-subunit alcohol dehydrogenase family)